MTSTTEAPGVNSAVEHLRELGFRMKDVSFGDYGFSDPDIEILDLIAEAVKELDKERVKTHELLETETIHSSILRHKLFMSPHAINKEIQNAVASARQSNADELKKLQDQLQTLNDSIDYLEKRLKSLEKQNAILHPERDMVRAQHEEVISQLNQRMADKASKQITLNETRDRLRETNQKIVDLETGIVILKEDMIQERADARQEKKRLKQAVHDTTKKTKKQKESNINKKKELDAIKEDVTDSETKLHTIRKSIRRFETSRNRLEQQEKQLTRQLEIEHEENEELKKKGIEIRQEREKLEEGYASKKEILTKRMEHLKTDMEKATFSYDYLYEKQQSLRLEIRESVEARSYDASKVKELNDMLQGMKEELLTKAEDMARMKQENDDMEKQIDLLEENHEASLAMLNKQITDYREALTKERKERFELQEKRDAALKELEDFRSALARYMKDMNTRLADDKQKHADLTAENAQLTKDLRTDDVRLKELDKELKEASNKFHAMEKSLTGVVTRLEEDITYMEKELAEKKQIIEDKTPNYNQFETQFDEKTTEFDSMKKNIVKLKNKRGGLSDETRRKKQDIDRISKPQSHGAPTIKLQLRAQLKENRIKTLQTMREQAKETREMEEKIYHAGRKLKSVIEENEKFRQEMKKMDDELASFDQQTLTNATLKEALQEEVARQRGKLEEGWKEDKDMEKEFAERDKSFLDDITELQKRTDKREQRVSDITDKLQQELVLLATFLETVANRRPVESRQSSRPHTSPRPPTAFRDYLDSRKFEHTKPNENLNKAREELKALVSKLDR
ncbi:coiled-coil domain-containing protein 175-like isoform X2 [Ptychodera flava]|uniref:coiled-coil domain-containing protein 175-like isoform X2 n=1 Tax=Ptychodera flava TaxID=63121 RepID=UPI003969D610